MKKKLAGRRIQLGRSLPTCQVSTIFLIKIMITTQQPFVNNTWKKYLWNKTWTKIWKNWKFWNYLAKIIAVQFWSYLQKNLKENRGLRSSIIHKSKKACITFKTTFIRFSSENKGKKRHRIEAYTTSNERRFLY